VRELLEFGAFAPIAALARQVGKSPDTPVLIVGERGTGVEELARIIHDETSGADRRFVAVRCGGRDEGLVEREIFGEALRSEDSAQSAVERARPGTLFIDDIAALGAGSQARLLNLIDRERSNRKKSPPVRAVRVVVGSRSSVEGMRRQHLFSEDLLAVLSIFELKIPPLRERRDEIVPLAEVLIRERATLLGKDLRGIEPAAQDKLRTHQFPGNLRELEGVIERAVIREKGSVLGPESIKFLDDVDPDYVAIFFSQTVERALQKRGRPPSLAELEYAYIVWLLGYTKGNRSAAARILEVSYPTIMKKITDYQIDLSEIAAGVQMPPRPPPKEG